jgi:hypothetical protein
MEKKRMLSLGIRVFLLCLFKETPELISCSVVTLIYRALHRATRCPKTVSRVALALMTHQSGLAQVLLNFILFYFFPLPAKKTVSREKKYLCDTSTKLESIISPRAER